VEVEVGMNCEVEKWGLGGGLECWEVGIWDGMGWVGGDVWHQMD
jgi:hypothetical protein